MSHPRNKTVLRLGFGSHVMGLQIDIKKIIYEPQEHLEP